MTNEEAANLPQRIVLACATSYEAKVCGICGRTVAGSGDPLGIVLDGHWGPPVCDGCARRFAPAVLAALEAFYRETPEARAEREAREAREKAEWLAEREARLSRLAPMLERLEAARKRFDEAREAFWREAEAAREAGLEPGDCPAALLEDSPF